MQKRALLIVNPTAGKMQGKSALFPVTDGLCRAGYLVTTVVTAARGDAETAARDLSPQYDLVVCCGGDGTLGEVVNGLLACGQKVPLGYIPLGSTNDFANSLALPHRIPQALDRIVNGTDTPLDVGCFGGERYFTYIASFGAFTAASYSAPQAAKNALGHLAYILEGVKELGTIQPYHVKVETADRVIEGDFLFGAMCNSTSVAGLVKLDPSLVDMGDGLFEAVLVRPPKNATDIGRLINSINTGVFDPKMFEFFKASCATFTVEGGPSWSLDGEEATAPAAVTVQTIPQAIILRK